MKKALYVLVAVATLAITSFEIRQIALACQCDSVTTTGETTTYPPTDCSYSYSITNDVDLTATPQGSCCDEHAYYVLHHDTHVSSTGIEEPIWYSPSTQAVEGLGEEDLDTTVNGTQVSTVTSSYHNVTSYLQYSWGGTRRTDVCSGSLSTNVYDYYSMCP